MCATLRSKRTVEAVAQADLHTVFGSDGEEVAFLAS